MTGSQDSLRGEVWWSWEQKLGVVLLRWVGCTAGRVPSGVEDQLYNARLKTAAKSGFIWKDSKRHVMWLNFDDHYWAPRGC